MKKINLAVVGAAMMPVVAMAQEAAAHGTKVQAPAAGYWAAGIVMGLGVAGAAYSQSRAAVAALEGIGRNPAAAKNLQLPLILSLALMEALVLFGFLVAGNLIAPVAL